MSLAQELDLLAQTVRGERQSLDPGRASGQGAAEERAALLERLKRVGKTASSLDSLEKDIKIRSYNSSRAFQARLDRETALRQRLEAKNAALEVCDSVLRLLISTNICQAELEAQIALCTRAESVARAANAVVLEHELQIKSLTAMVQQLSEERDDALGQLEAAKKALLRLGNSRML